MVVAVVVARARWQIVARRVRQPGNPLGPLFDGSFAGGRLIYTARATRPAAQLNPRIMRRFVYLFYAKW